MSIAVENLPLQDLKLVTSKVFEDERGYFTETYKLEEYQALGLPVFVQDNLSFSRKDVLRGLHFQKPPKAQAKFLRCLSGQIWDVVVDLRKNSSTFKQWYGIELWEKDGKGLFIPEGFAHGFLVLSETALVSYKITDVYDPDKDSGIYFNDPEIGITWPVKNPVISDKDAKLPLFKDTYLF